MALLKPMMIAHPTVIRDIVCRSARAVPSIVRCASRYSEIKLTKNGSYEFRFVGVSAKPVVGQF